MSQRPQQDLIVKELRDRGLRVLSQWAEGSFILGKSIGEVQTMLDQARNIIDRVTKEKESNE